MICCLLAAAFIALRTGVAKAQDVTRDEIEHAPPQGLLEVWFPRIIDEENGGFLCDFDYEWKPAGRQPKSIVFQARLDLARRRAASTRRTCRYLEAARHGFAVPQKGRCGTPTAAGRTGSSIARERSRPSPAT